MDKDQIRNYIEKYKDSHSKDAIKSQLRNSGAKEADVELVYQEFENNNSGGSVFPSEKKGNSGLALALVIIGFFIPLIGFFMIIAGIVIAHKSRKIKKDGMSMAALIIGYFIIVLQVLILILGIVMFSYVDFGSLLPNNVELDNGLVGLSSDSIAFSQKSSYNDKIGSGVLLVFNYMNPHRILINSTKSEIILLDGNRCQGVGVVNVVLNEALNESISFVSGQLGMIYFDCENDLVQGKQIEGNTNINMINLRTNVEFFSTGSLRLIVN